MPAAITCTSCRRPLRVPETVLGRTVQCPLCLDEFTAQADPAAEAAARAAEPPRRAARPEPAVASVRAAAEPPPLPDLAEEPVLVEPLAQAAPPEKGGREPTAARAFVFPVLVTRDPDRILRGRMDAELTAAGLTLRQPRQPAAFAAAGGKARYLGANRLVVTVEGREVELAVVQPRASVYHVARDVAAFLGGQGPLPERGTYVVPWYLYALPALFVALPAAAIPFGLLTDGCLGGFLWTAAALALGGVTLAVALQPRLRPRARLIGAGGLLGMGVLLYLVAIPLTPRYTVDASLWRTYLPSDGGFRVLTPGAPTVSQKTRSVVFGQVEEITTYTVDVQEPDVRFTVYVMPTSANNGAFNPTPGRPSYQTISDVKNRITQDFLSSSLTYPTESDGNYYSGLPYHELVYRVMPGYSGYGGSTTTAATTRTLVVRIYGGPDRTYALTVLGARVRADGADVVKFFDSFQITNYQTPKGGPQVQKDAWGKDQGPKDKWLPKDAVLPPPEKDIGFPRDKDVPFPRDKP